MAIAIAIKAAQARVPLQIRRLQLAITIAIQAMEQLQQAAPVVLHGGWVLGDGGEGQGQQKQQQRDGATHRLTLWKPPGKTAGPGPQLQKICDGIRLIPGLVSTGRDPYSPSIL